MNRFSRRVILLLLLVASVAIAASTSSLAHAQLTGLVCIDTSSSTSCPSSAPVFSGSVGSFITVAVNIQGSDSTNGFDIRIQADPTIINGTSINLAGTVLTNIVLSEQCVNGFFMAGACQPSPGTVEVIVAASSSTTSPTTGRLFSITYHVVGTTSGTPITYPTGCTSSSVSGTTTCVSVTNAGTIDPENIQAASFSAAGPPPDFTITVTPASQSIVRGSSTTFSVRVMGTSGFNNTVTLIVTVSPVVRHGPTTTIPSTVGPYSTSTLMVSTAHNTPTGAYTVAVTGTSGSLTHSTTVAVTVTR